MAEGDPRPLNVHLRWLDTELAKNRDDPERARDALREQTQFNAIETQYACKIDLIIRRDRPFSQAEFARRIAVDLSFAKAVSIVTPEDAILPKLELARRSGDSEKPLADAAGVLDLNPSIDREYIEHWAGELGVSDLCAPDTRAIVAMAREPPRAPSA
jgi:hypothetical protein